MTFPPMRPQIEIQRVHDMLMDALSDQRVAAALIPGELVGPLMMAADCLCWVLHHDVGANADSHAENFATIIGILRERYTSEEPPADEYLVSGDFD